MGVLKNLGKIGGMITGRVLGAPFKIVGDVVDSKYISGIGQDISKVTYSTGDLVGKVSSGAFDIVAGAATRNKHQLFEGVADISNAGVKTAKGVLSGTKYTIANGKELVEGILELNADKIKKSSGRMARVAIVASVAIGIADVVVDGMVDDENNDSTTENTISVTKHEYTIKDTDKLDIYASEIIKNPQTVAVIGDPASEATIFEPQKGANSCAVAAQREIIESETGNDFSEETLAEEAESRGWYNPDTGTRLNHLGKILEENGVEISRGNGYCIPDLISALQNQQSILVPLDANEIWYPEHDAFDNPIEKADLGHAVRVTGIQCDAMGKLSVVMNDPGITDGAGKVVDIDDFLNAWDDYNNSAVITAKT